MRSRNYTKVIELWQTIEQPDQYGGNVYSELLVAKSWCNIKTSSSNRVSSRLTDIGITDISNTIIIRLRYRNDIQYNAINKYIKYNGDKYIIQNVLSIDLNDVEIEIIATREQTNDVEVIAPINV